MTSWAGRYVSTTRRGSSASPTCLRDWSTSSCTRCETADRWEVRCKEQPAEQTIQMPCTASTRAWHDNSSRNTCWPTPLVHISAPRGGKDAWILICACAHEKETRQCYCWGGGEDILCHVCFVFLLQNETRNPKKKFIIKISALYLHLHDLPLPFSFHHRDVQISLCILSKKTFLLPSSCQLLLIWLAPVFFAAVTHVVNTVFLLRWVWPWLLYNT